MKVRILFALACLPLANCTVTNSLLNDDSLGIVAKQKAQREQERIDHIALVQERERLIAQGAMSPRQRAEADLYRAYIDLAYPVEKPKPK